MNSSSVNRLHQKINHHIKRGASAPLRNLSYVYLDCVIYNRSWAAEVRNISVLIAIGVGADGYGQILGVVEAEKEGLGWRGFLPHLKDRG